MRVDLILVTTSSYLVCCVFCLLRSAYTIKTITPVNIHRERSFVSQTKCLSGLFTAYGTVSSRRGSESLFTI